MMTRVCHVTSAHSSNDIRIFFKECTSLAKAGYETYLVAPGESRHENGVVVIGLGPKPVSRIKRMVAMSRRAYKVAVRLGCDIYHIHDPELLPFGVKLKKLGHSVIFDSHENYPEQIKGKAYLHPIIRKIVSRLYRHYETKCVRKFDAVVFPCTIGGKDIFGGRSAKTVFINNLPRKSEFLGGIDFQNFKDNARTICYAGRIAPARGITHLMKAAYAANVTLLLAGTLDQKYLEELKLMKEFAAVEYLGNLGREEVQAMYRQSFIGMSTLLLVGQYGDLDNLPTKVYEYLGAGLPVILTDYPYGRQFINQFECGICVRPDSIEEIADAIVFLCDNPEKAYEMGQKGRRVVMAEYNWEKEEEKLIELYKSIK